MIDPRDFDKLPPELRQKLHAKLLEFLAEHGIRPMVNRRTGELVVPLEELSAKLGISEEEGRRILGRDPRDFTVNPDDVVPLQ
ncbi:hypothetical protein M0638_28275 [Roseomonas sp. NAR14]|uniref:Uncharacterized protein n=1 Tax=Roseomonas acroporae TaxID=2937791 RepID=A0A9X1YGG7_9PROT|nr:hypothetical protein [Roseomonas acroporae]MCK8788252.1 hypothetical protein [Roseomonas acroporae]